MNTIRKLRLKKKKFTIFVSFLDLMLELTIQMTDKKDVHRKLFYCFVQKFVGKNLILISVDMC